MNESSYDEDAGYGSENESYEQRVNVAPVQELAIAAPALPQELEHIKPENVFGKQSKRLVFSVTGTPAEFARKKVIKARLSEQNQKELHQVLALQNRHAPQQKDLGGDLDQIIVVGLRSVGYVNGQLQPGLCDIKGQVPNTLTCNTKTGMLLECTGGLLMKDSQNVLSPVNMFLRDMLEIWETCDASVLPKEFQVLENLETNTKQCLVYTKGSAASLLASFPQLFDNYRIQNKDMVGMNMAVVPNGTAEKLYNYMQDTINDIRKSFTSAKDIEVSFRPESGSWDNVKSFIGNQAVLSSDKQLEYQTKMINTPARMAVHLDMEWITVSNIYDEKSKNSSATNAKGLGL